MPTSRFQDVSGDIRSADKNESKDEDYEESLCRKMEELSREMEQHLSASIGASNDTTPGADMSMPPGFPPSFLGIGPDGDDSGPFSEEMFQRLMDSTIIHL